MNNKLKVIILAVIVIISAMFVTSCFGNDHYGSYDDAGYSVSVKYDANGGTFTAGTQVIVDTYNLELLPTKDGKKIAKLITPDDEVRGDGNTFTPTNKGYFLAGWYETRTEIKDESGKVISYKYENQWDFQKGLELDPNGKYSAENPVLTLYAAWVPQFSYEFYEVGTDTLINTIEFNPNNGTELSVPQWNKETGKIDMYKFPQIKGKTFNAVYLDKEGKNKVETAVIQHSGSIDSVTAIATNTVMKLYVESIDGEWYHINTAEQFISIANKAGSDACYLIENDIDFSYLNRKGEIAYRSWMSSFVFNNFSGKLIGKEQADGTPVVIKNIRFNQSTNKNYSGLLGQIVQGAEIRNIAFEDIIMTMNSGAPLTNDANFGLLAGAISDKAIIEDVSITGVLKIDTKCIFKGEYSIGLLCGFGKIEGIDFSGVTYEVTGEKPESLKITVSEDGNGLTLEKNSSN